MAEKIDVHDTGALPMTEPTAAPIFDTGPFPEALQSAAAEAAGETAFELLPEPTWQTGQWVGGDAVGVSPGAAGPAAPARSVVVPGQYTAVKWWQLLGVLAAVWLPAGAIGAGLYYWWVTEIDKAPAIFVTLVYVVACTVGGLVLAMSSNKPLVAAAAIAVMTAVFASLAVAAPFYGRYYCQVIEQQGGRCLAGIVPY